MVRAKWLSSVVGVCAIAACGGDDKNSGRGNINGATPPGESAGGGDAGAGPAAPAGSTIFARSYGDEGQQSLGGSATDDAGNIYVVGRENPTGVVVLTPEGRTVGPEQGTANGMFVIKYSPTGELLWRQPFPISGDSNFATLTGVALQPTTGAVILAGWVSGSVTLDDGTTLTSGTDPQFGFSTSNLVLIALDTAGYLVWSRLYTSPATVEPDNVFVTASGDIEVVGRAGDNATVGGAPICCRNTPFNTNTFLARFSPIGDPIWSTGITGGEFFSAGAGADADGGIVVGGSLVGSMTFDGTTYTGGGFLPTGPVIGVALRTDPQGHLRWIHLYQGPSPSRTNLGAGVDRAGNVLLFGGFAGTLDLGNSIVLTHAPGDQGTTAGLLAKLTPDGEAVWAHQFPAQGFDTVEGRVVSGDAAGNIVLAGVTAGGLSLGGSTPPLAAGMRGDFVAKYDAAGNWRWDRGFAVETSNDGSGRLGLGVDGAGRVSLAGEFDNTVDFGTGPLTAPGQTTTGGSALPRVPDNVFVIELAP